MQELPEWPVGTVAILATGGDAPHAIPVSTILRAGPRRVLFALGSSRGSLARLRVQPRVALSLMVAGDVAVTVHGRAHVVAEPLPGAGNVVAVALDAERLEDHARQTFTIDAGVAWHWTDDEALRRDADVRAALRALIDS